MALNRGAFDFPKPWAIRSALPIELLLALPACFKTRSTAFDPQDGLGALPIFRLDNIVPKRFRQRR
jgi:hypothetical protein